MVEVNLEELRSIPVPEIDNDLISRISKFTEIQAFLFDSLLLARKLIVSNEINDVNGDLSYAKNINNFTNGITGVFKFDRNNDRLDQTISFRNFHSSDGYGNYDSKGHVCGSWDKNTGLHWKLKSRIIVMRADHLF